MDPTDDPMTGGTEGSVTAWIGALRGGDSDEAAHRLWDRYFDRLVDLARARLRFAARGPDDEEDAALSAFESLCRGVTEGRFVRLGGRDELWRLMATITARKAADRIEREGRQKRGGGRVRGEAELDGPGERGGGRRARRVRRGRPGPRVHGDDGRGDPPPLRRPARGVAPPGGAPEARGLLQRRDRREPRLRRAERRAQARPDPPALGPRGRLGMSTETGPAPEPMTPMRAGRIDAACDRFEALWRAVQRPRIEDFLAEPGADAAGPGLLQELMALELELRDRAGERPDPAEYAARFPAPPRRSRPPSGRHDPGSSARARADGPGATVPDTPTGPGTAAAAGTVAGPR